MQELGTNRCVYSSLLALLMSLTGESMLQAWSPHLVGDKYRLEKVQQNWYPQLNT
jgi:hypothetical protein